MCESVCKALIQHGFWSDNEVVHTTCCSQFLAIIERMENVSLLMDVFFLLVDSLRNAIERQAFQLTYFDFVAKHPKAQTLIPTIRILERMLHRLPKEWSHSSPKVHARVYQSTFSLLLLPFTRSPSPTVLTIMASLHAEKDHKMHWFQLWLCRSPYRQQIGCSVRESGFWNAIWDRIDVCQPLEMLQTSVGPLETVERNVMREVGSSLLRFQIVKTALDFPLACDLRRVREKLWDFENWVVRERIDRFEGLPIARISDFWQWEWYDISSFRSIDFCCKSTFCELFACEMCFAVDKRNQWRSPWTYENSVCGTKSIKFQVVAWGSVSIARSRWRSSLETEASALHLLLFFWL